MYIAVFQKATLVTTVLNSSIKREDKEHTKHVKQSLCKTAMLRDVVDARLFKIARNVWTSERLKFFFYYYFFFFLCQVQVKRIPKSYPLKQFSALEECLYYILCFSNSIIVIR